MAQAPAVDPLLGFQRDLTERVKKELNKDNPCTQALHAVRREQQVYHGAAMAARWREQKRAASKESMAKKCRKVEYPPANSGSAYNLYRDRPG